MTSSKPKYTPRGYQTYILEQISSLRGTSVLVELDCGLGKRFIQHQLVTETYPELRFIIVVHSSSSLAETLDYLRSEYGGLEDELGEISSRVRSGMRKRILQEKRVIVATPQVLAGLLKKDPSLIDGFDVILINEVDTLIRRTGGRTTLVFPWPALLLHLEEKWIVGMSGTLRDDHAVFGKEQVEIRNELVTLREHLPGAELITMEDLYGTDVEDHLEPTFLMIRSVVDSRIRSISKILDELIRNTRTDIMNELAEDDNLDIVSGDSRRIHLLLERLPVRDELKSQYSGLLMLRKYVYAMPPKQFMRMFYADYLKHYFNVKEMRKVIPDVSSKVTKVLEICMQYDKTVVITSYLEMVAQIEDVLKKSGMSVHKITGETRQKGEVLRSFKEGTDKGALVMSPVGERDLDIPQAEAMILCDTINTTKTMYQKLKRTRGGLVVFLTYSGTSEEVKVRRLIKRILERYPWSSTFVESESQELP